MLAQGQDPSVVQQASVEQRSGWLPSCFGGWWQFQRSTPYFLFPSPPGHPGKPALVFAVPFEGMQLAAVNCPVPDSHWGVLRWVHLPPRRVA